MPPKSLEALLQRDFDTLSPSEQGRVFLAGLRVLGDPWRPIPKAERPCCGARCRDGHPCRARAVVDAETGTEVVNGRCRMHGGWSTGPRTEAGRQRIADSNRRRATARRA